MPRKFNKSAKLNNHVVCFDTETDNSNPYTCNVLEICAIVYDINTLEQKEVEPFHTLVKPLNNDWSNVSEKALQKNKLTRKRVDAEGVDQQVMFEQLVKYLQQFQRKQDKWNALIPAGFNIHSFDNIIMDQMCFRYGYLEGGDPKLFHPFHCFDLFDILRLWFHNSDELESFSLDTVRQYFGISTEGSHAATKDTEDTWLILKRFLKFHREMASKKLPQFKGCFS